jgi:hypothetical protein
VLVLLPEYRHDHTPDLRSLQTGGQLKTFLLLFLLLSPRLFLPSSLHATRLFPFLLGFTRTTSKDKHGGRDSKDGR